MSNMRRITLDDVTVDQDPSSRPTPEASVKKLDEHNASQLEIEASSWSEESGTDDSAGERLLPDIFLPASEEERIYKTVWMVRLSSLAFNYYVIFAW
jgi:hypothetical protein